MLVTNRVANEGKMLAFVPAGRADEALAAMRAHPLGRESVRIGEVVADHPRPRGAAQRDRRIARGRPAERGATATDLLRMESHSSVIRSQSASRISEICWRRTGILFRTTSQTRR